MWKYCINIRINRWVAPRLSTVSGAKVKFTVWGSEFIVFQPSGSGSHRDADAVFRHCLLPPAPCCCQKRRLLTLKNAAGRSLPVAKATSCTCSRFFVEEKKSWFTTLLSHNTTSSVSTPLFLLLFLPPTPAHCNAPSTLHPPPQQYSMNREALVNGHGLLCPAGMDCFLKKLVGSTSAISSLHHSAVPTPFSRKTRRQWLCC